MTTGHRFTGYMYRLIAAEISTMSRYYDAVVQVHPVAGETGYLLEQVDAPKKVAIDGTKPVPDAREFGERVALLMNGTFNHSYDVQQILSELKPRLTRTSRLVVVLFNPYLQSIYRLAVALRVMTGPMPTTFLTHTDLLNLCELAGYETVLVRRAGYCPWRLLGLGSTLNRIMPAVPGLRHLSISTIVVLRPVIAEDPDQPTSLSVLIPARNERGNIAAALERLPDLGGPTELIFVEGHSSDGTWEEIQRVAAEYQGPHEVVTLQQTGKGKADAVRLGFSHARGELLTILDADLTMPPEMLPRFVDAYRAGLGDFINGSRIVYPMEGEAMRRLNRLGNVFFAKALTGVLGVRLGDSLCGTKMVRRDDYLRMIRWREDFGDFDPFGDFELLFPAATMGLGVIDVPIRYAARTYGSTQISRFSHGLMLLKMTIVGFFSVKLGKVAGRRGD